jgi:hypothetical protein
MYMIVIPITQQKDNKCKSGACLHNKTKEKEQSKQHPYMAKPIYTRKSMLCRVPVMGYLYKGIQR